MVNLPFSVFDRDIEENFSPAFMISDNAPLRLPINPFGVSEVDGLVGGA